MVDLTREQWIRQNTDKFLLLAAYFGTITLVLHLLHHGTADKENIAWAENLAGQAFAAFLTLIVSQKLRDGAGSDPAVTTQNQKITAVTETHVEPLDPKLEPKP